MFSALIKRFVRHLKKLGATNSAGDVKAVSWSEFIGETPHQPTAARPLSPPASVAIYFNPVLASLSPEDNKILIRRLDSNQLDEIKLIQLYQRLFNCEVNIVRTHVHLYEVRAAHGIETLKFTDLKNRILVDLRQYQSAMSQAQV
jgi:hypothetical protein